MQDEYWLLRSVLCAAIAASWTKICDGCPDVAKAALELYNAWMVMFNQLRPMAINWATRLDEVIELDERVDEVVKEWAEKLERAKDIS